MSDLRVVFGPQGREQVAVDGVSLTLAAGEVLGLVGESGCGKSLTALAILGLLPRPVGRIERGRIEFRGKDLVHASQSEMNQVRGKDIAMIFQEPMTALNPVIKVGEQIAETIRVHEGLPGSAARRRALELLERVGISNPDQRIDQYPHELSGGMRQRVMIAIALACRPKILIADEPTTALDVTIQAQILALLKDLQTEFGMAMILITHDLGVVAQVADEVLVMYAGRKVESGPTREVLTRPRHPYTQLLLQARPHGTLPRDQRLAEIPGMVLPPHERKGGCNFAPRCPHAQVRCTGSTPVLVQTAPLHQVACVMHDGH